MDPAQSLLEDIDTSVKGGGPSLAEELVALAAASHTSPSSSSSAHHRPTASTRRTKLVFVYSDEDEEEKANPPPPSSTAAPAEGLRCTEVAIEDDLTLRVDSTELDAMRQEAEEAAASRAAAASAATSLDFMEDLAGFTEHRDGHDVLAGAVPLAMTHSDGMRVRVVEAPTVTGALRSSSSSSSPSVGTKHHPRPRRRLALNELTSTLVPHKRFRVEDDGEENEGEENAKQGACSTHEHDGSTPQRATGKTDTVAEEEIIAFGLKPAVVEADGTVRVIESAEGYRLTVDERDLLESDAEDVEEGEEEDNGEKVESGVTAADGATGQLDSSVTPFPRESTKPTETKEEEDYGKEGGDNEVPSDAEGEGAANGDGFDDLADWEDEEDEEDAEAEAALDEALVVAVVVQLVQCCESEELDEAIAREAVRFTGVAKPLLAELEANTITSKEFGDRIDRDLRRFQRVFRNVYRPRDAPIVIDGVQMDL